MINLLVNGAWHGFGNLESEQKTAWRIIRKRSNVTKGLWGGLWGGGRRRNILERLSRSRDGVYERCLRTDSFCFLFLAISGDQHLHPHALDQPNNVTR